MKKVLAALAALAALVGVMSCSPPPSRGEVAEIKIPLGAGGFGFLPLYVMQKYNLIEKQAASEGVQVKVSWINVGGPAVMNDALLSGSVHFIAAGPPAFLTLWDRTRNSVGVKGVAAMSSMPMYLNARTQQLRALDDINGPARIGVTAIKVSIPSIIMQMHATKRYGPNQTFRFDPFTVTMAHPDALIAMTSGSGNIVAHWASAPFSQRELKDPAIKTLMNSDDIMGGSTTFTMISTTTKFQEQNPKVYAAVVRALKEAESRIEADKPAAAALLLESMGGRGWSVDELVAILNDPSTKYTMQPENVLAYATFMHQIGTLKNAPAGIGDLFFETPEVAGGN